MSAQAADPAGDRGETGPGAGTTGVTVTGAAAAEAYLRLLTEAELRQRPLISGPGPHRHRVWLAAMTLASAGVVGPDTAWRIVAGFETAAVLRTRNRNPPMLTGVHAPHWVARASSQHGASQHGASQHGASGTGAGPPGTSPAAGGPDVPTAVAVGATLPAERDGWYGEFCLLSLARTGSQAALAVAARWAGQSRRAAAIVTEPVPPASTAARVLNQSGDDLLCLESATPGASARLEGRVAQVLQDLIGSGALRADDPAVLRLAGPPSPTGPGR